MALKLEFDPQARTDLAAIRAYLLSQAGPAPAERVRAYLRRRIRSLLDNPRLGVATTEPAIRVLPPTRYPYRIFYTVTANAIVILHIRHSARRDPDFTDPSR
jgi:plasmid stabilization system protein ParE